jgi:hypothetical protein
VWAVGNARRKPICCGSSRLWVRLNPTLTTCSPVVAHMCTVDRNVWTSPNGGERSPGPFGSRARSTSRRCGRSWQYRVRPQISNRKQAEMATSTR